MTDVVVADEPGSIRVLTLNRPEKLNAFTAVGYRALHKHLDAAADDPTVAVCVLTGRGRAFSTGVDLNELRHDGGAPLGTAFDMLIDSLARFPKPLIAAVNGDAVGFGATLLLHCDLVLIDQSAQITMPFVQLSTCGEAGSTSLLPHRVGIQQATWMMLSGAPLDAMAAVANGFAVSASESGRVLDDACTLARQLSAHPIDVLVANKQLLNAGRTALVADAWQRERSAMRTLAAKHGPIA